MEEVKVYMDDNGHEVPLEEATQVGITQYDEDGDRIKETVLFLVQ